MLARSSQQNNPIQTLPGASVLQPIMKQLKWIVVCLLLNFVCGQAWSQAVMVIQAETLEKRLDDWLDVSDYLIFQKELNIDSPERLPEGWQVVEDLAEIRWEKNCWLKLPLQNDLEIPVELVLLIHADLFTVWQPDEAQNNWKTYLGGDLRPRNQWDSRQNLPVFSSPHTIQFSLPPQSKQAIFIQVDAPDQSPQLSIKLASRSFFLNHSTRYFSRVLVSQSLIHGILWIMLFYHLLIFFMNREWAYFYYAAYVFGLSLSFFYLFEVDNLTKFTNFPVLSRIMTAINMYVFGIFYALFLRSFLHEDGWRADLCRWLNLFIKTSLVFAALNAVLAFLPYRIFPISNLYWITLPFSSLSIIGFCYLSWQYWRSEKRLVQFIAANNFFLLFGVLVSFLIFYSGFLNWIPLRSSTFWAILFWELTVVLQLLSFALSLSYKGLETERERTRLKEIDQLKSRFFAQISHEFRTPLTLILGPLKQLKAYVNQPKSREQVKVAETYAQKLLSMVNQILDLTQLEAGKMELEPKVFDIVQAGKVISYSFDSIAIERNIKIDFSSEQEPWLVYLDKETFEQLLVNLLSNALKYNRQDGQIEIKLKSKKGKQLLLEVSDTGQGIPEDELPHIFQLYYQSKKVEDYTVSVASSGIGLAYVKELIDLQNGQIEVVSQLGKGSTFSISLPLPAVPEHLPPTPIKAADFPSTATRSKPLKTERSNKKETLVLVVEDQPDIQRYIQVCLEDNYELLFAGDGSEGLEVARKEIPDLIITDVMMPKMDGFTLTKTLKEDTLTSHIPIIILTGKSSKASQLEGLRTQADEYLTKPFDAEELELRIHNILANRQKWIERFQQNGMTIPERPQPLSMEEKFLKSVEKIVQEHKQDENFGVEQLGRALRLDRTQLFRKLKAITGENPSHFIRVIRLQSAYEMLQNQQATISEIAFEVGFSNPSYFNRTFKAHFGKTPGEVMKENWPPKSKD